LSAPTNNQAPGAATAEEAAGQNFQYGSLTSAIMGRITPTYDSSGDASSNRFYTLWVLAVHFVLSLHNGWIDPVLSRYRRMYREEERQA